MRVFISYFEKDSSAEDMATFTKVALSGAGREHEELDLVIKRVEAYELIDCVRARGHTNSRADGLRVLLCATDETDSRAVRQVLEQICSVKSVGAQVLDYGYNLKVADVTKTLHVGYQPYASESPPPRGSPRRHPLPRPIHRIRQRKIVLPKWREIPRFLLSEPRKVLNIIPDPNEHLEWRCDTGHAVDHFLKSWILVSVTGLITVNLIVFHANRTKVVLGGTTLIERPIGDQGDFTMELFANCVDEGFRAGQQARFTL
jgi:hypothetical protein